MSSCMNKPNTLPLTDMVIDRARAVAHREEFLSDQLLPHLLQYQCIIADVHDVYRASRRTGDPALLPTHARALIAALEAWWALLPYHLREQGLCSPKTERRAFSAYYCQDFLRIDTTPQRYESTTWACFFISGEVRLSRIELPLQQLWR